MPDSPRFVAADPRRRLRVATGSALLVGLAGPLAGTIAPHLPVRIQAAIERCWGRAVVNHLRLNLEVRGDDGFDHRLPHLVLPLHESLIDPALLLATMPSPLRFVLLDEILEWPWMGRYLRSGRHIALPVTRGVAQLRRLVRWAEDAVESGESPVVFPQGSVLGIETGFHRGAFTLARHLGIDLLPVVITGTHRVWEHPFTPQVRYGERVTVRFLAPRSAAADPAELQAEMKDVALGRDAAPPRRFVPERDGWWDGYPYLVDARFGDLADARQRHNESRNSVTSPTMPDIDVHTGR